MDPQTTWEEMLDAIAADNSEAARESANNLLNWLYQGGFPPQPLTRELIEFDELEVGDDVYLVEESSQTTLCLNHPHRTASSPVLHSKS